MPSAYETLETRWKRISAFHGAMAVLHWDRATMMPSGGAKVRARQLSELGLAVHETVSSAETGRLLDRADAERAGLDAWQNANLDLMRRAHENATVLPAELVAQLSEAASECEMIWRDARADNDFARLAPALQTVIDLTREEAELKARAFGLDPYDGLLDGYDRGRRLEDIERLFSDLEAFLPDFLDAVLDRQAGERPAERPEGPFPADMQEAVGRHFMTALGFDFDHGRLDVSLHPFTGGVPDDSRITTRYDQDHILSGLMGVIHETGHSLYERGLPADWRGQPVGQSLGMTVHESQSLLFEMQTARGSDFAHYAAPVLREITGRAGSAWEEDNLFRLYTRVERGLIRVDADEVTYPLHVILRTRLERRLIGGDLKAADLPSAWNEGMEDLLGIAPPDDKDGVMQDIHWPSGAFGYFPTYTLGALAAAQMFAAAQQADGAILPGIREGDFAPLLGWLRKSVHECGSRYAPDELIERATGAPLGTEAFKAHLQERYLPA